MPPTTSGPFIPPKKGELGFPLAALQEMAISLTYKVMGESRYGRTAAEYEQIAARLPRLKVLHGQINQELRKFLASAGEQRPELCRFKAGDELIIFETLPDRITYETVRIALVQHSLRIPRRRRKPTH